MPPPEWGGADWRGGPRARTSEPQLSPPRAQPQPAMGRQGKGLASLPGPGLHSQAEMPALGTSVEGPLFSPVGRGAAGSLRLAFQLSVCLSRAAPPRSSPPPPLLLVCTAGIPVSSYHVPRHTQRCPSAKPHTWNCFHLPCQLGLPFPKGSGTLLL